MRRHSLSLLGLLLPLLQACSLHPLQQDATDRKTIQLVDRIRCETKFALQNKIITLLEEYHYYRNKPWAKKLAADLRDRNENFQDFGRSKLKDDYSRKLWNRYVDMGIAFDFTLDVSEQDKVVHSMNFSQDFLSGTFGFGFTNTADLTRRSTRNFVVSDRFGSLINQEIKDCDEKSLEPNLSYPISGSIGMKELIDTFVDLNRPDFLVKDKKNDSRVFADTLEFTTILTSTGGPKASMILAAPSFHVADAALTGTIMRTDLHKVIVGLAVADTPKPGPRRRRPGAVGAPALASGSPAPTDTGDARVNAVNATINQRLNTFLDRFGSGILR